MDAHVSVPDAYVSQVTGVEILTCFEIVHIKDMDFFCNQWELNGNIIRRLCRTHRLYKECRQSVQSQIPSRSARV